MLRQALTHRSFSATNNERLEFLGDSLLSLVITEALYHKFNDASEGELSRLRASLVKGETLAILAKSLGLGEFILLGDGEIKTGGAERPSILADAFEALLGAVFLDSDLPTLKTFVLKVFEQRLSKISLETRVKDAKTQLQEALQAIKQPLPNYEIVEITGDAHCQRFTIACTVSLFDEPTVATANSRKTAEKQAAEMMLSRLEAKHGQ